MREDGAIPISDSVTALARLLLLLAIVPWTTFGCGSSATTEDEHRLRTLRSRFGDRYEFGFQEPLYVRATSTRDGKPQLDEAKEIFRACWLTEAGSARKSSYVYLNI